jgi:hypothetical protein
MKNARTLQQVQDGADEVQPSCTHSSRQRPDRRLPPTSNGKTVAIPTRARPPASGPSLGPSRLRAPHAPRHTRKCLSCSEILVLAMVSAPPSSGLANQRCDQGSGCGYN